MELSLCLEMLFVDRPLVERMQIASKLGYRAVEFWDWREKDLDAIARTAGREGLTIAAMSGNRRHPLIDPQARIGLIEEMREAFEAAKRLGCRRVMMLSDVLEADGAAAPVRSLTPDQKFESLVDGLRVLAVYAKAADITLLIEPLNSVREHRRCFLDSSDAGAEAVRRVASANVRMLYDVYHMSMMGEDVLKEIERKLQCIGYIHVADMPGRHQPGSGRIDYPAISRLLQRVNHEGIVGMEYSAAGDELEAARIPLEVFKQSDRITRNGS